ncbi:MAG TPA: CheR family methyltransferase [Terriglobales bacterium]|jgi:DNA-binding NarL/FixJ family response regulator
MNQIRALIVDDSSVMRKIVERSLRQAGLNLTQVLEAANGAEALALVRSSAVDLILCDNVLIYFDPASKKNVIHHFYDSLLMGGYFFLGHSESLYGINDDFRLVHFPSATGYTKSDSAGKANKP